MNGAGGTYSAIVLRAVRETKFAFPAQLRRGSAAPCNEHKPRRRRLAVPCFVMNILGINAYYGSASAAVVCDGRLVAAVKEERFNRVKYAAGFPAQAIRYCLREAGLKLGEIDHVAVPRNPYARLGTKLFYALRMPSFARSRIGVLAKFTGIREALAAAFDSDPKTIAAKFHRIEHHQAHLASAFFVSPFEKAALLSADGL